MLQIFHKVHNSSSIYKDFPLEITLYQYEASHYSSQIRAYLDYFGFPYSLVEVDPYTKAEIKHLTKTQTLPICVLTDKDKHTNWYLTNSTSIVSALEALRTEDQANFPATLAKYLPLLTYTDSLKYPMKYVTGERSKLK
jgi:microsomal prostaglandin-E synthase 2